MLPDRQMQMGNAYNYYKVNRNIKMTVICFLIFCFIAIIIFILAKYIGYIKTNCFIDHNSINITKCGDDKYDIKYNIYIKNNYDINITVMNDCKYSKRCRYSYKDIVSFKNKLNNIDNFPCMVNKETKLVYNCPNF